MIRNALRRSTASAQSLSRAMVPHPLRPQSPAALSARGFHAVAKSGQRRSDTMLPTRRHGHSHSATENSMKNTSWVEEKKAALLQVLLQEEAAAAACKRNQLKLKELERNLERKSLKAEKVVLEKEVEALKDVSKARTEELLATIGRQGASGVDQETLMLARWARAGQDIEDLKFAVGCLIVCASVLGVATGILYISK